MTVNFSTDLERFTGRGIDCDLICTSCNAPGIELDAVCRACRDRACDASHNVGFVGEPGIVDEPSLVRFEHLPSRALPIAGLHDLRPCLGGDRDRWVGVTTDLRLVEIDLDRDDRDGLVELTVLAHLPHDLNVVGDPPGSEAEAPSEPR